MSPYLFDAFNHILVLEDDFLAHIQKQKPITIIPFLLLLVTTSSLADGFIIPPPEFPPLSVKYHHVDVTVDNQVATTRVDQVFVNKSPFQMEGDYIFPLPDDVSISEFAMYVAGERLKAEVLESRQAREIYEEIVRQQRDPALLEYIGTNMLRARVFPIEANSEKRIELEYTEVLTADAGLTKYRYPLNTEKFSAEPLESVSITVDLHSNLPMKTIYSPSHSVEIVREGEFAARITYADENIKPETDFLLYYSVSIDDFGVNLLTHRQSSEDGFYLLMLTPKTQVSEDIVLNKNIVFVFDSSGSMRGQKIQQAKGALRFAINGLRQTDYFNIVDFSTEVRFLGRHPFPATAENVQSAMQYINTIEAIGGTNINDALLAGLSEVVDGAINMVVFLTDGVPTVGLTHLSQILDNVKGKNPDKKRIFVFGVGYDVNTKLLDQLAIDNRGITEYVRPEEDIEIKVSSFFTKIGNPVLSNPELEFSTVETQETYPKQIPDLFVGSQLIQYGRYTTFGPTAIILRGQVNDEMRQSVYEATFPQIDQANEFIPRLWATRKIGYLVDEIRLNGESRELVEEIVWLSKRYGIITPYTSFLILEDDPSFLAGSPEFQDLDVDGGLPQLSVGQKAVEVSQQVTMLKEAEDSGATQSPPNVVKLVGAKTFFLRNSMWQDSSFSKGTPTIDVQYASESYFNLLKTDPELGRYFALGPQVIVGYRSAYYRVVEAPIQPNLFPWDVNRDGVIDVFDLVTVGRSWGEPGGTGDVNADGTVNLFDLVLIANHFGERYSGGLSAPSQNWETPPEGTPLQLYLINESICQHFIKFRLYAESAADLIGYQFDLKYDPNVLELLTVEAGEIFQPHTDDDEARYFKSPQIDAVEGYAKHIIAMRSPQSPLSAEGGVAIATFGRQTNSGHIQLRSAAEVTLNEWGNSEFYLKRIQITNIKLTDRNGNPIPVHLRYAAGKTRIGEGLTPSPTFTLGQNYPNPFNPETWIPYQLSQEAEVSLQIYDGQGRLVRKLELGWQQAGYYTTAAEGIYWNGRNDNDEQVSSGVYFYRLHAEWKG